MRLPVLLPALLAALAAAQEAVFTTQPSMAKESSATTVLLERLHISKRPLSSVDAEAVLGKYAEGLDRAKLYLTEADLAEFRARFAPSLDLYLQRGNLTPAFELHALFRKRVAERTAFALALLKDPSLDLSRPGTFAVDRRKAGWPADAAAADDLWRRRVQLDLLSEALGDEADVGADGPRADRSGKPAAAPVLTPERLEEARVRLARRYEKVAGYLAYEQHEVQEFFLNALAAQYDPHSNFLSRQSLEEFEISMRNSLVGIGATLEDDDGYCTIKEIMPGGPLALDGRAKAGDRILAVGQGEGAEPEDIVGMRLNKAISRIRGKEGSVIRLILEPADRGPRKDITLKRAPIKLLGQLASARLVEVPSADGAVAIGVIDLPAFYGGEGKGGSSPTRDLEELIGKLRGMGMKALILDLRRNGGGLLTEAIGITGLFIPGGPVVQVRDSAGRSETYKDEDGGKVAWDGPLVVLTSKASASASEIVAGALRDHRRALIVGDDTTHGKGTVQNILELSRLDRALKSAVKVTIQKWYAPSGSSIQLKGVPADIPVPSVFSVLPVAESDLDNPLPWDAVAPSLDKPDTGPWLKAPLSPELLARLGAASRRRQAELPEFTLHARILEWTKARFNRSEVPLALDARRRDREEDLAFREHVRGQLEQLAKGDFAAREVKLDAALAEEKSTDPEWQKASRRLQRLRTSLGDESWPEFDIPLREAARIAADWAGKGAAEPAVAAVPAKTAAAAPVR